MAVMIVTMELVLEYQRLYIHSPDGNLLAKIWDSASRGDSIADKDSWMILVTPHCIRAK